MRSRSRQSLIDWVEEREQNALRIARVKRGLDQLAWMEDADYFACIAARLVQVNELEAENARLKAVQ